MRGSFWWVDRWQQSQSYKDMTLAEQGAFRNLLDELWLRGGSLPSDDRILAKLCGDAIEWPTVKKAVLLRFYKKGDTIRNKTHDEVSAESKRRAKKQADYRARSDNVGGNVTGNADGNDAGNAAGDVTPSPFTVHLSTDQEPKNGRARAERSPLEEGKILDDIECPMCYRTGNLKLTQARGSHPAGFWCDKRGGCGANWPLNTEAILSLMTPRGRKAIEAMLPASEKPYVSPGMILTSELKFDEKGMLIE